MPIVEMCDYWLRPIRVGMRAVAIGKRGLAAGKVAAIDWYRRGRKGPPRPMVKIELFEPRGACKSLWMDPERVMVEPKEGKEDGR